MLERESPERIGKESEHQNKIINQNPALKAPKSDAAHASGPHVQMVEDRNERSFSGDQPETGSSGLMSFVSALGQTATGSPGEMSGASGVPFEGVFPAAVSPPWEEESSSGKCIFIPVSEEKYAELSKPWRSSIICKVVGKSFSKDYLRNYLIKIWKVPIKQELIALGRGFYAFHCESFQERSRIMAEGPWFIQGVHIWTQNWEPNFRPSTANCNKGVVWMSLPELPLEFYDKDILSKVGSSVGDIIRIDAKSLEGGSKRFAKICLLADKSKEPPKGAWLGKSYQPIEFLEGLWYCGNCQSFGHGRGACEEGKKAQGKTQEVEEGQEVGEGSVVRMGGNGQIKSQQLGKKREGWTRVGPKLQKAAQVPSSTKEPVPGNVGIINKNSFDVLQNPVEVTIQNTEHTKANEMTIRRKEKGECSEKGGCPEKGEPAPPDETKKSGTPKILPNSPAKKTPKPHKPPNSQESPHTGKTKNGKPSSNGNGTSFPSTKITILKPNSATPIPRLPSESLQSESGDSIHISATGPAVKDGVIANLSGLHHVLKPRGRSAGATLDRCQENDSQPQGHRSEIPRVANVCVGSGVFPCSSTAVSECSSPTPTGAMSHKVDSPERGRSRRRGTKHSSPVCTMDGPEKSPSSQPKESTIEKLSHNIHGPVEHQCPTAGKHSSDAQANESMGKLGRGQRRKWPTRDRSLPKASKRNMDGPRDEGDGDTVEGRGLRESSGLEGETVPTI